MPTTSAHVVCRVAELPPGARRIVEIGSRSIGVFNIAGNYYALRNACPHQSAPLCRGQLTGTTLPSAVGEYRYAREGEILRCPWHGWEFDVTTGRSIFNPHRVRVRAYDVSVEATTAPASADAAASAGDAGVADDPAVETYPVTVEQQMIVLHV